MTASNHIPCPCCMAETGTLQTTGEGTGVMHDTDSIQARYTQSRHRGSEDAPDTDTLPRSGARRALGLWDRPRLHARSNPLVARPVRLACAGGKTERVSAIQGAAARDRRAFHSGRGKRARSDAVAADARMARQRL